MLNILVNLILQMNNKMLDERGKMFMVDFFFLLFKFQFIFENNGKQQNHYYFDGLTVKKLGIKSKEVVILQILILTQNLKLNIP